MAVQLVRRIFGIHPDIEELVAAHALDALDPAENRRIEAHLEVCIDCREAAQRHLEAIGLWASAADVDAAPPTWLWTSIRTQLDRPRKSAELINLRDRRR